VSRRRRKNPGSYWVNFALAATAIVGVLYFAKTHGTNEQR
jgi:hypothetical protein